MSTPARGSEIHWGLLGVGIGAKALLLLWLLVHGFPMPSGDIVNFKQQALVFLQSGRFELVVLQWRLPGTAYPPLYTFLTAGVFRAFGFGLTPSLAFDLGVHLLLTTGIAVWAARVTGRALVGLLCLALSPFLLDPVGRPEELAALLMVGALALGMTERPPYLAMLVLAGLAITTDPIQTVGGLVLLVGLDAARSAAPLRRIAVWAGGGLVAGLVVLGIWAAKEANPLDLVRTLWETWPLRHKEGFWRTAVRSPNWGLFFVTTLPIVVGLAAWTAADARRVPRAERRQWAALALCLPAMVALPVVLERPSYNYRLLSHVLLAAGLVLPVLLWDRGQGPALRGAAALLGAAVLATGTLANFRIVQLVLAPLTWTEASTSYGEAVETVERLVPDDVTVGGDPTFWAVLTDGRIFYSDRLGKFDFDDPRTIPDYLVGGSFLGGGGRPYLERRHPELERVYEHVHGPRGPGPRGCALDVLGLRIPISRSNCDWSVSIWRRRGLAP